MSAAFQEVLARLMTDVTWRERFVADRQAFASSCPAETRAAVRALDQELLHASAENLLRKRMAHVEELAPRLFHALGGGAQACFRAHALTCVLKGDEKHRADALHFAHKLTAEPLLHAVARRAQLMLGGGVTLRVVPLAGSTLHVVSLLRVPLTLRRCGPVVAVGSYGVTRGTLRLPFPYVAPAQETVSRDSA